MTDNLLIDIPEIRLPPDLARRVKFIDAVERHALRLGLQGRFQPPRFFGYFFTGARPVVVAGQWTVVLEEAPLLAQMRAMVGRLTDGRFPIASEAPGVDPDFMLVHDGYDGSCWLWDFDHGRNFLEASEPATDGDEMEETDDSDDLIDPDRGPKLLGP